MRISNVILFGVPDSALRADFLRVDRPTMQKLLNNAQTIAFHGHQLKIPALMDLLAMKLFALKHGWERRVHKDLPDIANLVVTNNIDLETTLKPACMQFTDAEIYKKISDEVDLIKL